MKRKKALLTYIRNESMILPLWLKHHMKSFDPKDIYVLDNQSLDDSVEILVNAGIPHANITTIKCTGAFTNQWLNDVASQHQNLLLDTYEWTILAEADEFIVVDPTKYNSWDNILDAFSSKNIKITRALGYDVVHSYSTEHALDITKPILLQRKFAKLWKPELNGGKMLFSKPVLSSKKIRYRAGGHDVFDIDNTLLEMRGGCMNIPIHDDGLLLLHLNLFDLDLTTQRRTSRVKQNQTQINGDRLWIGQRLKDEMDTMLMSKAIVKMPDYFDFF